MKKGSKKKKGGRKPGRRKGRRVSGFGNGIPMDALAGFAGFVAAKASNGILKKATEKVEFLQKTPVIIPLLKIGLGYYAHTSMKEPFAKNMGLGVMIQGGSDALEILAPAVFKMGGEKVEGIGTVIDLDDDVSGYDDSMQVENSVSGVFDYAGVSGAI